MQPGPIFRLVRFEIFCILSLFSFKKAPADGSSITIVDSPNIFWGGIAPPPSYNLNNIVFLSFFINSPISKDFKLSILWLIDFYLVLVVNDSDNQPNTFQEFVTQTKAKGFANIGGTPGFGKADFNQR